MSRDDEQRPPAGGPAGGRPGRQGPDDAPVLPDRSADDADTGWSERVEDDDERWHAERPPHWG